MKKVIYLLRIRSFIFLMVLFSFFDNLGMEKGSFGMETEENRFDYLFKVVFVGEAAVGKTQIINKCMRNKFDRNYEATTSNEFCCKKIEYNDKKIWLQLWDSSGEDKFRSLSPSFCRGAHLIVLVYDISNKNSFDSIKSWVNMAREVNKEAKFLLVGNKCDLENQRNVTYEEAKKYAEDNNMDFIEVSAKNGTNIGNMFDTSLSKILEDLDNLNNNKTSFCDKYCSCCPFL